MCGAPRLHRERVLQSAPGTPGSRCPPNRRPACLGPRVSDKFQMKLALGNQALSPGSPKFWIQTQLARWDDISTVTRLGNWEAPTVCQPPFWAPGRSPGKIPKPLPAWNRSTNEGDGK